jgi:hypothetical protein
LIGAALVCAHLRTLVDEWLETGRDRDGSEWPLRRDLRKAPRGWRVASEFLEQSPPTMYPSESSGFSLTIAEPHWGRPWAEDFFAAQEITAGHVRSVTQDQTSQGQKPKQVKLWAAISVPQPIFF